MHPIHRHIAVSFICVAFTAMLFVGNAHAQTTSFNATRVFDALDQNVAGARSTQPLVPSWWDAHVTQSYRETQPVHADIHTLLYLALQHSNQIKIAKREPLIQQTAIQEADANFDWVRYLDSAWNDTSQPIGNSLTAGGSATRLNDHVLQGTAGVRRLNRRGGLLDVSQQMGWQDNNSIFLVPDNQATSQLTISYTHPLMRGRGRAYNDALVVLAQLEAQAAENDFHAALQDQLLEVTRSYWALYLERAVLAHQMRLFLETQQIYQTLTARVNVDTKRTQLVTAASALENRRADLIRARTAVTNAETRLRGMLNAPELANTDSAELIPAEAPSTEFYQTDLQQEVQTAIQYRPEIESAIHQVKAGARRLHVAKHELMPVLNLVTQAYANGLRGDSDFGGAFSDQFSSGAPSYSIGIQYEFPVGNRRAKARVCRRRHELSRLRDQYALALEAVETEVDIAVRELNTAHMEIRAKSRALAAAEADANTIEQRWRTMVDGSGSAALNLESLLRAQERVTESERDYVTSLLTYNLAMISLKRANGTLLQSENVDVLRMCNNGCQQIELTKGLPEHLSNHDPIPTDNVPARRLNAPEPIAPAKSDATPPVGHLVPVRVSTNFPIEPGFHRR